MKKFINKYGLYLTIFITTVIFLAFYYYYSNVIFEDGMFLKESILGIISGSILNFVTLIVFVVFNIQDLFNIIGFCILLMIVFDFASTYILFVNIKKYYFDKVQLKYINYILFFVTLFYWFFIGVSTASFLLRPIHV